MSLGIDIKIDAPGALSTIAGVEAALAKVEAKGPAVGDALSKGLGAGAPAADKTTQSTEGLTEKLAALSNLGKNFGGALADQFKREADMLDKIHGPAKQYAADLQALDGLMMRGAVTTEEYAAQVTKMNAAIGEGPEKIEEAENATSKLGEAFEALKLPAIGAGILELGHKVAELAEEADRAQDRFTELGNKALKFEDATHSQGQIIDDMGRLGTALHTTREKAFELYDTVRDGTDGMRVSYADQATMAQNFGLANELAGHSVDQAADSMKRFMYDVAAGTVDIRAIKQQMVEVPEIADVWTGAFHTTRAGLLSMLESGKVSMRDLALAFVKPSDALEEMNKKAGKIIDTNEQKTKKWVEDITVLSERGMAGIQAIQIAQLGSDSAYAQVQNRGFAGLGNDDEADIARGHAALQKFNDDAQHLTGSFSAMGEAFDKGMGKVLTAMTEAPTLFAKTEAAIGGIIAKLDDMGMHGVDAWSHVDTAFGLGVKDSQEYAQKIGGAKKQLEALRLEVAAHLLGADDARKKYEGLMTTLNDGRLPAAIKMYDAIHEPVRTFTEDVAALNGMLKEGTITWDQYDQQMQKTIASSVDPMVQLLNKFDSPMEQQTRGIALATEAWASGALSIGHYREELERLYALTGETQANSVTGGKLDPNQGLALPQIGGGDYQMPKADFSSVPAPQSYAHGLGTKAYEANQNYSSKAEKEQYDQFEKGATDAISGVDKGLKQLRDNTLDIGKTMTESITGAFNKMNESIITMVTTGKANFSDLASFVEQALAKIALQEIEIGIISAFTGGAGGVAAKVAGSWSGSDTTIPHAANGYAGKVGGVGGTDTRLFAAMVTPGETVQIRTPEQMAAQGQGGGRQNVTIVNKHDTRGELAAAHADGSLDTAIVNVLKRNAGAVQALLRK